MALTLYNMLAKGFFPKELPPCFTSNNFAVYVDKNGMFKPVPLLSAKALVSLPAIHLLGQPSGHRRRLHIPNPFNYMQLAELLVENIGKIEAHLDQSKFSVSRPIIDSTGIRALKTKIEGMGLLMARARSRRDGRVLLRADVSRFYNSIYTHSIPWALDGKKAAKKSRSGGFANNIDARIRELQDGQTLGIPIGPDASMIISEIVATSIDKELQAANLKGIRFVDDYEIMFPSRSAAEAGLVILEEALAQFELGLNPRKTNIAELPIELERAWTAAIKNFPFKTAGKVNSAELVQYFDLLSRLKLENRLDPVLSYGIIRLRWMDIHDWRECQDLMCQCALAESGAMEAFFGVVYEKKNLGFSRALDVAIQGTIEQGAPLTLGTDIAWALWAAIWFGRRIPARLAAKLDGMADPVIALLTLHAKELGLISKNVFFPKWGLLMTADSLYNGFWLLAYEADLHRWLPSAEPTNHVDSDPNFSRLKKARVQFFEKKSNLSMPTRRKRKSSSPSFY